MLRSPIAPMNCHAPRTFFSAFFRSVGSAGRPAPAAAAQLVAEDDNSSGPAASLGAVQTCWAGATAPTAAHMSQVLLPIGMAQPHFLQTAMDLYRQVAPELP